MDASPDSSTNGVINKLANGGDIIIKKKLDQVIDILSSLKSEYKHWLFKLVKIRIILKIILSIIVWISQHSFESESILVL